MKYILILSGILLTAVPANSLNSPKIEPLVRERRFPLKFTSSEDPYLEIAVHSIGNVWMTVSNIGQFGTGYLSASIDPITGVPAPSCFFPAGSNVEYLYVGAFWIGAVVGRDTLVSIGVDDFYSVVEFWPAPAPDRRNSATFYSTVQYVLC